MCFYSKSIDIEFRLLSFVSALFQNGISWSRFETVGTSMSRFFCIEGLDSIVHSLYGRWRVQVGTCFLPAVFPRIGYSYRLRQFIRSVRKGKDSIAIRFTHAYAGLSVLWKSARAETAVKCSTLFRCCCTQSRGLLTYISFAFHYLYISDVIAGHKSVSDIIRFVMIFLGLSRYSSGPSVSTHRDSTGVDAGYHERGYIVP